MLIKILYWGMFSSGKTSSVDTLYRITKEQKKEFEPQGPLTKMAMPNGATTYFDRGIFRSTTSEDVNLFHVYTIAGQKRYEPLRKKVFQGTEGVIFIVDSQTNLLHDNIEALKELKKVSENQLIKEIPLIVMMNKQDLPDVISGEEFKTVLKDEGLWYETDNQLSLWNPIIYETCALYDQRRDIYRSFAECTRRTYLYKINGRKAPID